MAERPPGNFTVTSAIILMVRLAATAGEPVRLYALALAMQMSILNGDITSLADHRTRTHSGAAADRAKTAL